MEGIVLSPQLLGEFLEEKSEELGWKYLGLTRHRRRFKHIQTGLVIKIIDRDKRSDIVLLTNQRHPQRPQSVVELIKEYRVTQSQVERESVQIVVNYIYKP